MDTTVAALLALVATLVGAIIWLLKATQKTAADERGQITAERMAITDRFLSSLDQHAQLDREADARIATALDASTSRATAEHAALMAAIERIGAGITDALGKMVRREP